MVGIGVDARATNAATATLATLASPDRKRVASGASPLKSPPARLKDLRDDSYARECERLVASDAEQRQQQRILRFHARWPAVRAFYAVVAESVPVVKRKVWLRLVATQLHDAIAGGAITTLAQAESAVTSALHTLVASPSAWKGVLQALRTAVAAFCRDDETTFDYRELLCSCIVLDRWQEGELRLLSLWMDEYSLPIQPVGDMAILTTEISRMLMTPCASAIDEQAMAPHVAQLLAKVGPPTMCSAKSWVRAAQIKSFVEQCAPLRSLLKACCWRRLIDDMRLGYFRDVYRQAMERVENEEANCRLAAAMQLWQLREPRARLARWKDFVHVRKLQRRGDHHFLKVSQTKIVFNFRANRARRQQLRRWMEDARVVHEASLVRWTLHAWRLYFVSMADIHRAAWRRGIRHYELGLLTRVWKAYVVVVEASRAERARRQTELDQFIARRHLKVLRYSWGEWMFVYRRQKEVRVAMQLERQLHSDIEAQRREEHEQALMAIEDELAKAVELRQRQLEELARQRAFQEATDRVYANRKLKQQEEERTAFKRAREARAVAEMDEAWNRISERVATEVRVATLAWFRSSEGQKAVEAEATEIFERDPLVIQKTLLQDPLAFALPGCRWQLRLEDYGGRFAKPFFINTETLEKFVCDELIMDNCEVIAKEVLIQRRIDDARERLRAKAGEVQRERERHEAAIRIQMLFRCRHALLIVRNKIRTTFVKRIEPTTGDIVYFNIPKQATRRKPPRLIGSDEPLIPVESSTWVRRVDDDGNNYYLEQETGETSWTPPPHHFMCVKCKFNFATRRSNESGARFCIACYADGLQRRQFGVGATWTKLSVQPAKCVVCRNSAAEVVCHACRGDATCARCCQAVHRNPKLAAHRDMEYLVYT